MTKWIDEREPVQGSLIVARFGINGERKIRAKEARTDCCDAPVEWYIPFSHRQTRWLVCSVCHHAIKNSVANQYREDL